MSIARCLRLFTLGATLVLSTGGVYAQAQTIVATIQPLALVASHLTGQTQRALLPIGISPHDFSLRASDIRRIQTADLVIWLGPELEPYLAKVMQQVVDDKQLDLSSLAGVNGSDQHPWTNPDFLLQTMHAVSERILVMLPENSGGEESSLRSLVNGFSHSWRQEMERLGSELLVHQAKLEQQNQGYTVYHDGIKGFEHYFGINHLISFTDSDDQPPGARRLGEIEQLAQDGAVACVLIDHEARHKLIDAVISPQTKRVEIDILAAKSQSLSGYISALHAAILSCGEDQ